MGNNNNNIFAKTPIDEDPNLYINRMVEKYGVIDFINTLKDKYDVEYVADLFQNFKTKTNKDKINVIGVHYQRMYNGGTELVIASLIKLWKKMGYKVILFTDEEKNCNDYDYPKDTKRILLPEWTCFIKRLKVIQEAIFNYDIDIYIENSWMMNNIIWELLLCKLSNINYIIYNHGLLKMLPYYNKSEYGYIFFKVFRLSDLVITLSELNAKTLQMFNCNSYVIHNPIKSNLLNNKLNKDNNKKNYHKKHILWIGRIDIDKYIEDALIIFKSVVNNNKNNYVLDIVGTGPEDYIEKIKIKAKELGIYEKIVFHGYKADTSLYWKQATVFLFTSHCEGYPMVVIESKAYGVPCIMYNLNYLSLIKDNKGVLTADINDYKKMSDNLLSILKDEQFQKKLSAEALESFNQLKKYNLENEWTNIFNIIVNNKKALNSEHFYNKINSDCDNQEIISMFIETYKNTNTEQNKIIDLLTKSNKEIQEYNNSIINSFTYRTGKLLLYLPKKFYHLLNK